MPTKAKQQTWSNHGGSSKQKTCSPDNTFKLNKGASPNREAPCSALAEGVEPPICRSTRPAPLPCCDHQPTSGCKNTKNNITTGWSLKKSKKKFFSFCAQRQKRTRQKSCPKLSALSSTHTREKRENTKATQTSLSVETHVRASLNRVTPELHQSYTGVTPELDRSWTGVGPELDRSWTGVRLV